MEEKNQETPMSAEPKPGTTFHPENSQQQSSSPPTNQTDQSAATQPPSKANEPAKQQSNTQQQTATNSNQANQPQSQPQPQQPRPPQSPQSPRQPANDPNLSEIAKVPAGDNNSNKKKAINPMIAALLAVILIAGSVSAYFFFVYKTPEQRIHDAMANMLSLKSASYDGSFKISIGEEGSGQVAIPEVLLEGKIDKGKYEGSINSDLFGTTISLEYRYLDGQLYFRFVGTEFFKGLIGGFGVDTSAVDTSALEEKWFELDKDTIDEIERSFSETNEDSPFSLSEEDRAKFQDILRNNVFIKVADKLEDQEIRGATASGYKVQIDKEKFKEFMTAVGQSDIEALKMDQDKIKKAHEQIDEADLSGFETKIWIANGHIARISIGVDEGGSGSYTITISIGDFNKNQNITVPEGAVPFDEDTIQKLLEENLNNSNLLEESQSEI